MTYFADLTPCSYFGIEFAENLRAVGWLSRQEIYRRGEVVETFYKQLCHLLENPWNPFLLMGFHECEICRFTKGFGGAGLYGKHQVQRLSNKNLFVPGKGIIYVAPESIAHYIDAHEYCPPEEFCRAVMECAEMKSRGYLKAMLKNGGKALHKKAQLKYKSKAKRSIKQ